MNFTVRLDHYSKEYKQAGVSPWQMMDYVTQKKIPAQYDLEDLEHDLKVVGSRTAKKA